MILRRKHVTWMIVLFFIAIVAVVFQQILTSMTEQGIATGGPYDNAAAYPKAIAILIGFLIAIQTGISLFRAESLREGNEEVSVAGLRRPILLLLIFGTYLALLGTLGYHLTTAPMLFGIMVLCGMRPAFSTAIASLLIAFVLAYAFEAYLKVVLPGGIFSFNIPW